MLKVAIDSGNAPLKTGIGIYAEGLLHACQSHLSHEVIVGEAGVSWSGRSFRPLRRLVYLSRMATARRRHFWGADVVHFMNVYTPQRVDGVGYVGTINDLDPILSADAHTRRYLLYFRSMTRQTLVRAHVVVAISKAVFDDVSEYFNYDGKNLRVAGIGLSEEFMSLADAAPRITPRIPTLFYVGLINKKKNSAWLVRTFASGIRRGALPRMRLVLAGRAGFGFKEVRKALDDAGDVVQWINSPSLAEVVNLYCACSGFVFPSFREGFGIPLLEAMYCDKPIVASRIPASVELAGNVANFFTLGDEDEFFYAIRSALLEPPTTKQKNAARAALAEFSWSSLSRRYLQIYHEAGVRRFEDSQTK